MSEAARSAAERAVRESYGRLVALLAQHGIDLATAEDALADALRAALESWPDSGVPQRPEAWLLTTARRRIIDQHRHAAVRRDAIGALHLALDEAAERAETQGGFGDERLKLLFVCAHPAIDPVMHAPLMLQTVLGLDVGAIAASFLVSPAAMARRLVRAKTKIRETGIRFGVPDPDELASRLEAVLDAIYAAYGHGWNEVAGGETCIDGLAEESTFLARLVTALLPDEPEAKGLLALLLHCEARRGARRDPAGRFVPLSGQDVTLWDMTLIAEAEQVLEAASCHGRIGRFQLEAAIQSVHAARAKLGFTDWPAIALLYEGLVRVAPTMGALVGRAAAVAEARNAEAGWRLLQGIDPEESRTYQPFWALKGHLLQRLDRGDEARAAFEQAAALTQDEAVRAFLRAR